MNSYDNEILICYECETEFTISHNTGENKHCPNCGELIDYREDDE